MIYDIKNLTTVRAKKVCQSLSALLKVKPSEAVHISRKDYSDFLTQAEKKVLAQRKKTGSRDRRVDFEGLVYGSVVILRHSE